MKIENSMIVKVAFLDPQRTHFGHLGEIGKVENCKGNRFFIRFQNGETCGHWSTKNVQIIDLNKTERIEKLRTQISKLNKKISDIQSQKL